MRENRLTSIAIIGGGTAGWMTAAALSKILGRDYARIVLVESDEIGTVGVGEATIPQINVFNRLLGLDEDVFVRRTQGSFKLGIEFVNWGTRGERYFHPFGPYGVDMRGVSFHAFWQKLRAMGVNHDLSDFNLQAVMARQNRFMRPVRSAEGSPVSQIAYAFHFDASLYAGFLREFSEGHGVQRQEGKVVEVVQHPETGYIEAVTLADGRRVEADLFIDCTGFRGLLIEQTLKAGFTDWSHWLPTDGAWAVPCESSSSINAKGTNEPSSLTPYTRSTAREAGWQWRIPLQHRTGNGYVFSSDFIAPEAARETLLQNLDGKPLAEPRLIRFKAGHRKVFWEKNVVAIGLAGGFLEPLESTSIHLIQSGIAKLLQLFPDKGFEPADRRRYNDMARLEYEYIRDFIILHYNCTRRDDTAFWNHVRTMDIPERLKEKYDVFQSRGRIFRENEELFNDTSWFAVMVGQGMPWRDYDPVADVMSDAEVRERLGNIRDVILGSAEMIPAHETFIARHCATGQPQFA